MMRTLISKLSVIGGLALASIAVAAPVAACSVGRMSRSELRAEQGRDLREADLVFLARVVGSGPMDDPEFNFVLFEPLAPITGELPRRLATAVFYCLPLPASGETYVVLMRASELSTLENHTSPVLGYFDVEDVHHSALRRRVDRALLRANIE